MKNNFMKTFFCVLALWITSCSNTKTIPQTPAPSVDIVSEDPGVLIYPDDPERVLKICDSVNQIRILKLNATVDSLLETPKTYYVYVTDSSKDSDLRIEVIRLRASVDSLQDIISHAARHSE